MSNTPYPGFRADEPTQIGRDIVTADDAAAVRAACGVYSTAEVDGLAANYATAVQGGKADTALQPGQITSGVITAGTGDVDFDNLGGGGAVNVVDDVGGVLVHTGDGVTPGKITAGNIEATTGFSAKTGYGNERIETGSTELPVGGRGFYIYNYGGSAALILRTDNAGASHISTLGGGDIIIPKTPNEHLSVRGFNAISPGAFYNPSFAVDITSAKESGLYNPTSGTMGLLASRVEVARCTPDGMNFLRPHKPSPYTFATVPTASSYTGYQITISDRSYKSAYSDGTDWRFVVDGAIIS